MQISKLTSINFGQMRYNFERKDKITTDKQRQAMIYIEREISDTDIEQELEKEDTDIIATMKRNGNISLKLSKRLASWFNNIKDERYVPTKGTSNQKIQIEFNLKKSVQPHLIKKQMDNFIKSCQTFLKNPLSGNNRKIEIDWETKMENLTN